MTPARPAGTLAVVVLMTSAVPGGASIEGLASLEVRWILPGQLDTAMAGWFLGSQPEPESESREDAYLLDPGLGGLSVKVRASRALEVKMFLGSPGVLDLPGRARGILQYWRKWSFPFSPLSLENIDPGGWSRVRKQRRVTWFSPAGEQIVRAPAVPGQAARRPGARWNSPRSATSTRTGGPWAWKRPVPPNRSATGSRPPPRSSSPRPCRAALTCASTIPGRMRTGFARADLRSAARSRWCRRSRRRCRGCRPASRSPHGGRSWRRTGPRPRPWGPSTRRRTDGWPARLA